MENFLQKRLLLIALLGLGIILASFQDDRTFWGGKLMQAVKNSDTAAIQLCVNAGADVDCKDEFKFTPLAWAVMLGHAPGVQVLLERGADINAADDEGQTALMWASLFGHEDIVKILLLKHADVNQKTRDHGITALMAAAAKGHASIIRTLIRYGADVNAKDKNNNSALLHATLKGFPEVAKMLLDSGALFQGVTPTYTAVADVELSFQGTIVSLGLFRMGFPAPGKKFVEACVWRVPSEYRVFPALEIIPRSSYELIHGKTL
ncbi:ankyrin repeat domain-containing protein [Desulfomonile tiedjei]|uniref:Ankyrin repeat-containing protein n=1 Tax=Desulfomonile tiedjei (strain ATCC 49306 / DSM 6799 / DCB-1) TaxID=706587 RepID=I4CC26_DESTA|nr:ankyrin repeat domain-containing protein [Desulfomonile tiedjei]AFM27117.1 ankyrin repeat-containing protein [Desulfomonile tiedjei DSM 6799]